MTPGESLSVGQLMSCARASLLSALDAELDRFGLNSTHFLVLKHLGEGAARTAASERYGTMSSLESPMARATPSR